MKTYEKRLDCKNCGWNKSYPVTETEIPVGVTINKFCETAECPQCGCRTLRYDRWKD